MKKRKGISRIQQHFKKAILVFSIFFLSTLHAQTIEISVPFSEGFIGTIGTNSQSADNIKTFSTLGIAKAYFLQQSSTGQFVQGNDISGTIRLQLTSGQIIEFPGAIVWRTPSSGGYKTFGVIPSPTISPISFVYNGSTNFTIDRYKNLGFKKIGESITYVDGSDITGNAALSAVLSDLNAYLTATQALNPNGPVTVTPRTTSNTTPVISGTATVQTGETLSVVVNGILYTISNGLVVNVSNNTWSLQLPTLTAATYNVVATITNSAGYTLSDSTSNELIITPPGTPTIGISATQLNPFTACAGSVSAVQSFSVSGTNLINNSVDQNVVVTAPTGFEVSLISGSGYGSSVTLTPTAGDLNATLVYVRTTTSATGTPSGNIALTSTGATTTNVAVSGTVSVLPSLQLKLSPPDVSTSAIQGQVGTRTEDFNSFTDSAVPSSGTFTIGTFTKTGTANYITNIYYGAPLPNSNTLSTYLGVSSGGVVNVTLTDPSKYLGFWWAGGDNDNQVTIYGSCGGTEIQLAQFSGSTVTALLLSGTVTAIDGINYPSLDYQNSFNSSSSAYINLQLDNPNITFTRLEFKQNVGGGGFEIDNITTGTGYGAASFTTPSAPTITAITTSNGSATVTFTAPTSNGGTPITNYEYTLDGINWTAFSPVEVSSPVTITGLTNGTTYPIQLRAVNLVGSGAPSNILSATPSSVLDSDGDTIPDATDPDDDNDGLMDYQEQDCSASTSVSESLNPSTFYFVQWNSYSNGVLSGVINVPGNPVNVTVTNPSSSILLQNDAPYGGISNWSPQPSGSANLSTFRSSTLGEHKFVFDQPVNNPRFFINSLNKTLDLSLPGKILNSNGKFTGSPVGTTTQVLVGNEGTGTISFAGNVTEVSFTGRAYEFYCNFSLGISGLLDSNSCVDIDTDNDGIPNRLDIESDGDGVLDATEKADVTDEKDGCKFVLAHQTVATSTTWNAADCDGDGTTNEQEILDHTDPLVGGIDTDGDGVLDTNDLDDDNDGITDVAENAACSPSSASCDTDGDGIINSLDLDSDNDGITDAKESNGIDTDGDGRIDGAVDSDGVPVTANGGLTPPDTDGDGSYNPYDLDSDNDGITDAREANGIDADGDGKIDGAIDANGIPSAANGGLTPPDTDTDGNTNPYDTDSDGDGLTDSEEKGTTPNTPRDTDGDGTPDYRDLDSDNDGLTDSEEKGTTPNTPRDTDGDGTPDYRDLDSDNDRLTDSEEKGTTPNTPRDTDGDGTPDYRDLDSDNDGLTDAQEKGSGSTPVDTDGDGTPDYRDLDSDNDGTTDALEKGSGATPMDTDGDGIPNFRDLDADGDGIADNLDNCPLVANVDQTDNDNDGQGDACDDDDDNDGVLDTNDNCPTTANTNQADRDYDGKGDVCDLVELNITQAITPNGDGVNDTWVIYNIENHPGSIVRVFNRWGKEVFYSNNYHNDWDGHYQDLKEGLPSSGAYMYQIDLNGDGTIDAQGWLYITN